MDKGCTLYRVAGVVEHIGTESLEAGHYVAYDRATRLGNQQQQSSCSSSWCCADDSFIREVTLEQVLKCQAYILFYERMEMENPPPVKDGHQNSHCSEVKHIQSISCAAVPEAEVCMPFIPLSVVWHIWRCLCNDSDRIRMRLVSRSWHEYLPQVKARPWVAGSKLLDGICHYVHGKNLAQFRFKCRIPGGSFLSSCGDIIMMETNFGYSLWDPCDRMILKLPIETCEKIVMLGGSDSYALTYSSRGIGFCYGRPADESSWKNIACSDRSILDICKSGNEFYAVSSTFKIYKLDPATNKMEIVGPQQRSDDIRKSMGGYPDYMFLADVNDGLVVIALGRDLQAVHLFKVVWTTDKMASLVTVTDLGTWSVFLGRNQSIALKTEDFPGIHPNNLYLALESRVDEEELATVEVYDLTTRSVVDTGYPSHELGVPFFYHPSFLSASMLFE